MSKNASLLSAVVCAILVSWCSRITVAAAAQETPPWLWTIGADDNNNAEFALAPRGYGEFAKDGFFIVGKSDTRQDWPYVHPGPDDGWAGGRSHTFGIVFGLQSIPEQGDCRLVIDLIDTQNAVPPRLRIDVNGRTFEHATPQGAGDASVNGTPDKGREHKFDVTFPASLLHTGNNHIAITTLSGSWVLYDWIGLETPAPAKLGEADGTLVRSVYAAPVLVDREGVLMQIVKVEIMHFGAPVQATILVTGADPVERQFEAGQYTVDVPVPNVASPTDAKVVVKTAAGVLAEHAITLNPVRKWAVYLLPHSHVDIGYTHVQTDVELSHWKYYEQALEASLKTADYPPGAQFKWNAEVLWATDSYLKQASPEKRQAFIDAMKKGWIGLDALYGNELTGLCRPEELIELVAYGNRLKREFGISIESAMISDVPGYTWGIVSVLAESGVKYFSIGPNGGHRIGYTLRVYGDKPFWWRSPCGRHRILCWIPRTGYWQGFRGEAGLLNLLKQMEDAKYPYDLVQIRHCLGDNAGPGVDLSAFVRDWNARYAFPKLVIATTREMMQELERRYGDQLPEVSGDFTPYWEDGAASSARETALNRAAAERLVQAETLFAMLQPAQYPEQALREAWRNVVLYDEHTWGAHCSITQPESDFTKAQWAIKQKFALDADVQSNRILKDALKITDSSAQSVQAIDVFNTCSWNRTDMVRVPQQWTVTGDVVKDQSGGLVPSQRLTTGELAFLASDVAALGAKRFTIHPGKPGAPASTARESVAAVDGHTLSAGALQVSIEPSTGAIAALTWNDHNFVKTGALNEPLLNDYFYVAGRKPNDPQRNGPASIQVRETGPLVASVVITSTAPGCNALERELTVLAGCDRLDIANTVDKRNIYDPEGVHFAFPFDVPDGVVRMDIPWAVARVETDQLPGACKNYFTVQRWVDVANDALGVTLATVDAPLVEVGRITCDPTAVGWIERLEPSQTLYSYVMNNYWETNYKAGQEGPTLFRYSIRPHGKYDAAAVQRFGIERSQPLVAAPARGEAPVLSSLLLVDSDTVLATSVRPDTSPQTLIVRLFNPTENATSVTLRNPEAAKLRIDLCDLTGFPLEQVAQPIPLQPYQFVTVRVAKQ
jgi:alpha-mannosidase